MRDEAEPGATDNLGYAQRIREGFSSRSSPARCLSFIVRQDSEMSRFITIHSILAPVDLAKLERAGSLRVLGDRSCELSADGTSLRPIDEKGNLMGAIAVLWHDTPEMRSNVIDSFLKEFSPHPLEVRRDVVEDRYWSRNGDCGRYFQNEHGHFHLYEGYLLVSPDTETVEEFFSEGREMLVVEQ